MLCSRFVQDRLSINSDVDVTSCDQSSIVFDDDSCDIDVIGTSTPDNSSTEGEQARRTIRNKRRKQLLTERLTAPEFSEVCFLIVIMITICVLCCIQYNTIIQ